MIHFISQPSSRPIIFFTLFIFSLSSISAQAHDNLGLETGNLTGWTATGDAWNGQPVKGNTVTPRRSSAASQHVGNHWIGGYEPSQSDTGTGTLTSDPFKVTHPWASFLIGGGDHKGTRVEILDTTSGKKLFQAHGRNRENMSRVVVDLRKHQGEKISIRLVDEVKIGWGHINYDDFQFHQSRPPIKPRRISSSPLLKHLTPNPGDAKNSTVRSMYVPKGFQVDLIASEPDIRQPIAFTFDAKGRIWLAEALAYPHRQKDGKGQDRLVILEDSDGNGSFETKKIFADKLNLVSGFEIGYGGVFVGAAPHLLFIPDANGDDQPDGPAKVLLDGWDLKDTHETPNSFMWGHDGWLYGCHGVFNDSYVGKPGTPKDKRTLVKAGVWRFHPVTHKFEIYAHGGSNQWGLDYHPDGAMFMTHCRSSWGLGPVSQVIRDGHYWTQDNKNHRPFIATAKSGWNNVTVPHSNLIRSVSAYGHGEGGAGKPGSRAIYGGHSHVGTMIYLGDNWPEQYRGNLYTHNLHGHQMNREILTLTDSGYRAESEGNDQLYAPDKHYLAVDLKYGPDGAVYSIDWHDTQQCHSNNHAIWDRTNGRIYRMAWKQTYRPVQVDLTKSSDTELLQFLSHKNEWFARMAQHQLRQRAANNRLDSATANILAEQLFHPQNPHRLRALVALYGINGITKKTYQKLLRSPEETIRTQAVHYITEQEHAFSSEFQNALATLARTDTSARVRLALAGACQHRIDPKIAKRLLRSLAMRHEDAADQFLPKMIWYAYARFADEDLEEALKLALKSKLPEFSNSVFWYAARKDLNKAVEYANQLSDPEQISRFIAIVHQVLAGKKTAKAPAGWDKLVLKANSDPATQKHFTALNKIFNGQSTNKDTPAARITQGKAAFMICAACHAPGKTQPGPSLEEIAQVYTNKNDIIQWIKKPGKKRANYPAMPAFNHMDDHSLQLIAEYLLSVKKTSPTKKLPATTVGFKKIQLLDKYITEGASIGDVNADGKPDVIAGPLWWQGPDFKKSHAYAPVKIYPIKGPGMSAYSSNFFTFPDLITKDKWTDILKVGLPGQPAHLAINPGEKPLPADNTKHQCEHSKAQDHICNESPQYVQALLGEKKQLLSFSKDHITLSIPTDDPKKPWQVLNITPPNSGIKMGEHGLGIGDINGDKLPDILEKRGWWQQPKNWDRRTHWKFHPFPFAPQQGGAQMFSYDINGDGLNDVVTALNAHSWGMAWYQQVRDGAKITFIKHTVMTDKPEGNPYGVCFSQPHAMSCADIDGDGIKDIVTGKCFYAHNGRDPGAEQPAVLYWFKTTRHKDGTTELMPYQIDNNSGVGRQISTGDLNGDGKMDIVVGNKKGVFVFIHTKVDPKTAVKKNAKSKVIFREGESLTISRRTGSVAPQNMHTFGVGKWSGNSHLWWTRGKPNDQIELTFTVPTTGNYRLGVGLTKAKDYGIVQVSLDGKNVGKPIDLYNDGVIHTGTISLGNPIQLNSGQHRLGVKITGANPKAIKSYMFAIDYLLLHPGNEADLKAHRPGPAKSAKSSKTPPKKKFTEGLGNTLDAKAKSMEEQLSLFKLPEGFIIENVSHEKLGTIKPISLNFDDAGRLWTQTASEYPKDRNPAAFEQKGRDKILVFDQPHLRQPQTPRVYADGLVMPISILPHDDGVHMILGSKIFKLQDTNNDGKADKRTLLMSGFGVKDSHTCLHRLTRGPGNWIYCSQGVHSTGTITAIDGKKTPFNQGMIGRYRPDGTGLETIGEGMNNIWAWSINREGRTYIHEANDLGYSQAAFERDATYPSFLATASRNSLQHPPTSKDLGLDGTGFCGIATSGTSPRDFPAPWQDYNFVANPITGEINTVSYTVDELGNHHFKREADLVTCDDPMFRPVNVSIGPDGCLYIIDWYNRTISHGTTTRNLAKHDTTSGRIWRVRHKSQKPFTPPNIEKAPDADLLKHLTSGNLWEMRAALHQIGKRQPISLLPEIKSILLASDTPDSIRIHALWALENLRHFDSNIWKNLIASSNQNVRHEALRSLSTLQPPLDELAPIFESLTEEKSYYVLNELIRFLRDTPQKLSPQHLTFARSFYTAPDQLPTQMVQGWKKQYHALGGSYEKRFLNQLIDSIGKTKSNLPAPDEKKWSQFLAAHPKKPAAETKKLDVEITRLSKLIRSTLKGDAAKGKTHYTTRCAACHDSKLGGFAPPLGGGAHRDIKELLTAIIKPNDAVEGLFYSYRVIKKDGSTVEGFRSDLTHKDLTLTFMGGGKIKFPLSDIKQAGYVKGKSIMLENMHAGLNDQDMADLIAHLKTIK